MSSLVAGTIAASAAISGEGRLTFRGVAAGLIMTALAMFGFAVNDVFDYDKDRAGGIRRPVATGELSRRGAAWLAAALLLAAWVLSAAVSSAGVILAATSLSLLLYSPIAQRYPLCKDFYVAGLCCAPLYYGAMTGARQYGWLAYAVLACFVFGREILMDSDEAAGDCKAGVRTIAVRAGRRTTTQIGMGLMILASAALIVAVRGRLATAASTVNLIGLAFVLLWPGIEMHRRISFSRLPMLLGAVAVACGGV